MFPNGCQPYLSPPWGKIRGVDRAEVNFWWPSLDTEGQLTVIKDLLLDLIDLTAVTAWQGAETMADLSALTAEVTENGDAVASAVALLNTLAAELAAAATDPAAVAALADQLSANSDALAAAVVANTPAAPEPAPEEPPA